MCYNFYTSISCEPDTQLSTCLSPCDTIPCPVLAAGEMTHQRKHTIGDTTVIPKNLLRTFWHHQPKTDSNTSVDGGYQHGLHLRGQVGDNTYNVRDDFELIHPPYYYIEHHM